MLIGNMLIRIIFVLTNNDDIDFELLLMKISLIFVMIFASYAYEYCHL